MDRMDDVYIVCIKQKTAYEMRISDWSSDVCSSDLEKPSVKAVSYSLGFSSPSSFCYAFRRATGVTPREFRRAEERRVGQAYVMTCRSRWSQSHYEKISHHYT